MSTRSPAPGIPLVAVLSMMTATLLFAPAPAGAQAVEGRDYRTLTPPQPTSSPPGKIELIEFFSYGCPHCNDFYPLITAWLAKQPKDIFFKRVPVGFGRPQWVNLARAYYALLDTGDLDRLDGALFHAIHAEHLQLYELETLATWVGKHGGDADKFTNAYASFGVNNQTVQADQMAEDYQVTGIPTLAVGGSYVVLGAESAADEHAAFLELLKTADKVIAMARAQMHAAHPPVGQPH
ncbi:MAG: thiol:disulfide interchange protein DsbA/DsbL [Steroidobacteraceae bacterium]